MFVGKRGEGRSPKETTPAETYTQLTDRKFEEAKDRLHEVWRWMRH